ncbi:hypothetical protein CDAR_468591 [Caerostris darwini]|uniref:Uncharacterized protein n=1 Tax=Caerostris darwini TaxID=1538125 RepID=A0AAV4Q3S8_9ARAC|nr:hypothetical protein CDAR_468591 [Caerostris darwini]
MGVFNKHHSTMAENLFAAGNVHLAKHVNALKGRLHGMNSLSIREMGIVYYGVGEQVLNYGSRLMIGVGIGGHTPVFSRWLPDLFSLCLQPCPKGNLQMSS